MAKNNTSNMSMNLFGIPYQLPPAVDPRVSTISTTVGKKFTENIMLEAPICTIIPGVPSYLPKEGRSTKISTAMALVEAQAGNFGALTELLNNVTNDDLRLYDFENQYNEYIKYVNVMCRAGASFLELEDVISAGSKTYSFEQYLWQYYRWNTQATKSILGRFKDYTSGNTRSTQYNPNQGTTVSSGSLLDAATNYNYVQFYIDPDISAGESVSNTTGESMMKGLFENGGNTMKDIAFMANSGGMDTNTLNSFVEGSASSLQSLTSSILGGTGVGSAISRLVNLGGDVLKGHNIIIPDIWQNNSFQKNFTITVHLKTPYGTKLGYYLNIFVPMMHLLALALPRQQSANSYSSPFILKAYVDGLLTCNLGMAQSVSIQKIADSCSTSGLPSEVDVSLDIVDLYSNVMMTPSDAPMMFLNNSSLIEYIATNCGVDLTAPNYTKKWSNAVNTIVNKFKDIGPNISGSIEQGFFNAIDSMINI